MNMRTQWLYTCAVLLICGGARAATVVNEIPGADPLVPFERYLLKPSFEAPTLSPDGRHIAVLAEVDGVSNLMIADTSDPTKLRALTHDRGRGLQARTIWDEQTFRWAPNGKSLFYLRDDKGDENWVLYSLDTVSGESRRLTPANGVRARALQTSASFPDEVLFGMNDKEPSQVDYYRANAVTGEITHVTTAAPYLLKLFDRNFQERVAISLDPKTLAPIISVRGEGGDWRVLDRVKPEDAESLSSNHINDLGGGVISADGRKLFGFSSEGLDTTAWVSIDLTTGKREILGLDKQVDVKRALVDPTTLAPQAYLRNFTTAEWVVVDPQLRKDFDLLKDKNMGEMEVESRTRDDSKWIVSFTRPDFPISYFLYDRTNHTTTALGLSQPQLAALHMSDMHALVTKSSDGYPLVSYLAYPSWVKLDANGIPHAPQPVITFIHGGPSDERAEFGFAPLLQWMTNRGYTVFLVNFRGSVGFGKAFMNAQRHEWGGAMNRDVLEQVHYLVEHKIADPKRMAVFGGSYGGYETLVAMTLTPGVFACGNAVVGPSNLETFIESTKEDVNGTSNAWYDRLGDPRTEEGRKLLKERSPFNYAAKTTGRMLIVQGANDVRVPTRESEQVVQAMQKAGVPVTYLLYPDEGHGIIRPANNRSFIAISEVFFGQCLGGRYVQLTHEDLEGSSVRVPAGGEHIPGLEVALQARHDEGMLQANAAIDRGAFGEYAGNYDLKGYTLSVTLEGKQLFITIPGQGKHEMLPLDKDGFFVNEGPVKLRFKRDAQGAVSELAIETSGGTNTAARMAK